MQRYDGDLEHNALVHAEEILPRQDLELPLPMFVHTSRIMNTYTKFVKAQYTYHGKIFAKHNITSWYLKYLFIA